MFASVLTATLRRGALEEGSRFIEQLYAEVVIPFLRENPGYRGALTFLNRGLGTITGVVLYETEEDAHYLDQDGPHWVELFARIGPERSQHLAGLLTEPIHRRVHAIIAEDLALLGE